jgi:hypothetical protein
VDFPERRDVVGPLEEQAGMRVPELVPIRYGRMLVSPFAFYSGGAVIMAADLARWPDHGRPCSDRSVPIVPYFPSLDADVDANQWIDVLDELATLHPSMVVPSHGDISDITSIAEVREFSSLSVRWPGNFARTAPPPMTRRHPSRRRLAPAGRVGTAC